MEDIYSNVKLQKVNSQVELKDVDELFARWKDNDQDTWSNTRDKPNNMYYVRKYIHIYNKFKLSLSILYAYSFNSTFNILNFYFHKLLECKAFFFYISV